MQQSTVYPRIVVALVGLSLLSAAPPVDLEQLVASLLRQLVRTESPDREAPIDIDSLSPEERKALVEETRALAVSFLQTEPIKRLRTERFTILTDLTHEENIQMIAGNLDSTFDVLDTVFGKDALKDHESIPVYVYRAPWRLAMLTVTLGGGPDAAGVYVPDIPLLAFHTYAPSNQALAGVMIHEATHAYLDHYVRPDGIDFPLWLEEGVAKYIGNSEIRRGKLLLGTLRRKQRTMYGNYKSPAYLELEELRKSLRGKKRLTLTEVLSADRETFYGEESHLYYAASWMLVHFLRHGDDDRIRGRFLKLVQTLCDGEDSQDAVRDLYGELPELESAYGRYVRQVGD